jgi:Na+/H+ antiporter NhaC
MLTAERRARRTGKVLAADAHGIVDVDAAVLHPADNTPRRARNAILPLLALITGTLGGMVWQGLAAGPVPGGAATAGERLRHLLANAHSEEALLWASVGALALALVMTFTQRLLTVRDTLRTALRSTKALYVPIGILFCAWSLGHICQDLGTSLFLTALVEDAMTPLLLPLTLFAVAGSIAFATGTSFGTMAILLPNVVVLAHALGTTTAFTGDAAAGGPALMLLCIAAVLEGSIFGDHCSPISDTTVLSSLGTQCDHLAHVTTQLPYALLASATSLVCGYLPMVTLGPGWWPASLLGGLAVMAVFLLVFGRNPDTPVDAVTSVRPGNR